MMKTLLALLLLTPSLGSGMDFDDCILKYMKNTGTTFGAFHLQKACKDLYDLKINKKYSKCIIKNMVGQKNKTSEFYVQRSCQNKYNDK